jgi:CheY-like chemotaxis protein
MLDTLRDQHRALSDARTAAEAASRARGQFFANISHEIHTPLNGVTGMAQALVNETDATRIRDGLRIINQSAASLLTVINDVLDFSKLDAGQLALERIPLDPRVELETVVTLMQSGANEQGTALELETAPDLPTWILGDPTRCRQIAFNLVSNAVKFSPGKHVHVRLGRDGDWLCFEVEDSGIGMSPEVLSRLFTPFMQADASTTRRFGGTGLGLTITRKLVEAMGGTITAQSTLGTGTTFRVRLPLVVTEAPPSQATPAALTRRQVLLVEDNLVNQLVALRLLEKLGQDVTVAADGVEALAACEVRRFDLVLMDCHMPRIDGLEATRQLRARGYGEPIVALTAAVSGDDTGRCLAAGMNGVLHKPLAAARLVEVLAKLG